MRSFSGVRENLVRLEAAGSIVGVVRALSGGDEADRRVFNLLYHALDALEGREEDVKSVEAAFGLKLSILAGYTPRLDTCVSCGRDLGEAADEDSPGFAPSLGSALCANCCSASDSFPLPPGTLAALQSLVVCPIKEAAVEERLEENVCRVVFAHVLAHAPGNTVLAVPGQRRTLHLT